ncbi:SGNH/GDSL hydrolase family protein [Avibacterium paragallinarum]|uniref:SGNH/GDSL hydrolase family protein n=1 Tax=Avibacterium paragallinarum TaxID=728 RepID=UPI00021ACF15|nr:DUF459 domain-containing protein [Avibacterium paragallinarum]AZI14078.1 DUF459 domain-containing protein [Avibacterium paragallinarum]QIR11547.1 DUF459 domain-containing protein [Avibacterium paragallinarum]QJE09479.1 DUF459 domain-containing protein [Avibacterium paragallinarum]QJE11675.1 DUF459 domain-containing protein [Avibacterium paragallinarum]QJE13874.1 DUF459 domain-containing protein [Avibacterium paragallinarum]
MQTFEQQTKWYHVATLLFFVGIILLWFSQASINRYWQQVYHQESPLRILNPLPFWQGGAIVQQKATNLYEKITALYFMPKAEQDGDSIEPESTLSLPIQPQTGQKLDKLVLQQDEKIMPREGSLNQMGLEKGESASVIDLSANMIADTSKSQIPKNEEELTITGQNQTEKNNKIVLQKGDIVFFAGDSLMQGIAPHLRRELKNQYGINSIDLSKQSTGLSYPNAFDWPKTIETTLTKNQNIKLLILFLGPNDPWDMPGEPAWRYVKFKSPEWETLYRKRIQRIVQAAKNNNVEIIWLGIPFMKSKKLNKQTRYIDNLYFEETNGYAHWFPTDYLLSKGEKYTDSIEINGKNTRVRSKDGIHFSLKGQQYLAQQLFELIEFRNDD